MAWSLVAGLEAALALAGPFLLADGLLHHAEGEILGGLGLVALALGLFLWETRNAPLSPFLRSPAPSGTGGTPWWTNRTPWVGQYLCVGCGFRQRERATFCPRCGKVLVRLPPPARGGPGSDGAGR